MQVVGWHFHYEFSWWKDECQGPVDSTQTPRGEKKKKKKKGRGVLLRDGDAAQLPSGAWLWPLCKLASAKSFVREAAAMSLIPGPPKMLSYPGFPPSECKMHFGKCNNKPRTPAHLFGGFNWNHRTSDWWWWREGCCYKPLIEFAWCLPWKCFFFSFLKQCSEKNSIFLICKSLKLTIHAQPPPPTPLISVTFHSNMDYSHVRHQHAAVFPWPACHLTDEW